MKDIKSILMKRDKMTESEAENLISEAREQFEAYLEDGDTVGAENICSEYFGLEPDFLDEFI